MTGGRVIYFDMLDGLIDGNMARAIADCAGNRLLTELRIRAGRQLVAFACDELGNIVKIPIKFASKPYIVSDDDIKKILSRATNLSLYSVSDELVKGYIPSKKARIGVCGEGVSDGGKLIGIKNIGFITVRIPHEVKTAADKIIDLVCPENATCIKNTLVISPPGAGKTTLLRELARRLSYRFNVVIIDERYELAASNDGVPSLDVGDADVISGVKKSVAYESCVRAATPDVIVTDELFRGDDVAAICDIARCGVKAIASAHGSSAAELFKNDCYKPLKNCFELAVALKKHPVGSVLEVVEL